MIATNGFLNSLPVNPFSIQNPKSKIQNCISLRFRALCCLADECGKDVTVYC
ncbi:Mo-dependent nitrogenase C-terminal domain-containing protein [Nostoc sp. PCC 7107]|uniref:Mo-dependent nitrogenase C-terminal domain-containing protein n=1 Tax=Nostoc sp. PCC 7107 TaxID=317936 RepID=UPI0012F72A78